MDNLEQYLLSLNAIKKMKNSGILNESDYKKSETFLAKKYCIKNGSLFRENDLINSRFRAIYMTDKKGVYFGGNSSDEN